MNSSHQFISDIRLQLQAINDAKRQYILEIKQQLAYHISQFAKNSKQAQNRTISDKIRNNSKSQVLTQQYRNKKSSQHQIFSNPCKQVFLFSKLSNGFLNIYSQSQKEEKNLRKQYKLLLERKSRLFKQNLNLDDSLYILRRQISVQKRKQTIVDKQKLITQQQSKCFDCKARLDQNFDSKENVLIFRIGKIQQNLREQENKLSILVDERYKLCQQQQNSALNVAQKQKMLEQIRYCDQVSLRKYNQLKKRSNEIEQRLITAKNTNEELISKFQRLSIKNQTYNNRLKPVFEIQTCRIQVIQQKLKGSCERLIEQRSKWLQSTIKSDDISLQNHQHDFKYYFQ